MSLFCHDFCVTSKKSLIGPWIPVFNEMNIVSNMKTILENYIYCKEQLQQFLKQDCFSDVFSFGFSIKFSDEFSDEVEYEFSDEVVDEVEDEISDEMTNVLR